MHPKQGEIETDLTEHFVTTKLHSTTRKLKDAIFFIALSALGLAAIPTIFGLVFKFTGVSAEATIVSKYAFISAGGIAGVGLTPAAILFLIKKVREKQKLSAEDLIALREEIQVYESSVRAKTAKFMEYSHNVGAMRDLSK